MLTNTIDVNLKNRAAPGCNPMLQYVRTENTATQTKRYGSDTSVLARA